MRKDTSTRDMDGNVVTDIFIGHVVKPSPRKVKFKYRPGTYDSVMLTHDYKEYEHVMHLEPTDYWLDLGANIGLFSCSISPFVKQVVAYEPDLENMSLFRDNLDMNDCKNVIPVNKAVVKTAGFQETRDFFINEKYSDKAVHTLVPIKGRKKISVPVIGIEPVITLNGINKIKMDIEGGELEVCAGISEAKLWGGIKEFMME